MPLLHGIKKLKEMNPEMGIETENAKTGKGAKEDKKVSNLPWVKLIHTEKIVTKNDTYILGHPDIQMPAIISTSSHKGVKARLVTPKNVAKEMSGPPKALTDDDLDIIREWEFTKDDQTIPINMAAPLYMNKNFWVEMQNPHMEDAVVNAIVHGIIKSNNV